MRYRVYVWKTIETSGFLHVEAETHAAAQELVEQMDEWNIDDTDVEWGGCGDSVEIGVDYAEEDPEPSVSNDLWQ